MQSDHSSWTDLLIMAYHLQWPLYGSLAKTLSDHHRSKGAEDQPAAQNPPADALIPGVAPKPTIWKSAAINAAVATLTFVLVFPVSQEMSLNSNWQKVFLYIAGYMGFQLIDIVQAQVRFRFSKILGGQSNDSDKR